MRWTFTYIRLGKTLAVGQNSVSSISILIITKDIAFSRNVFTCVAVICEDQLEDHSLIINYYLIGPGKVPRSSKSLSQIEQ